MICKNCGEEYPNAVTVCPKCGAQPEANKREELLDFDRSGLITWSVLTLFFCAIPGIVALILSLGINRCSDAEEQRHKIRSARIWCSIGTVLGVLSLIGNFYLSLG